MKKTSTQCSTKDRILQQSATNLLSKRSEGFAGGAVRDICSDAEANIAAVNYYFGGKGRPLFERS